MDEITVKPKSEAGEITPAQANIVTPNYPAAVCAAGLGICFFLPWGNILGIRISGFDLQKSGGDDLLLWSIPIFSAITLVAALTNRSMQVAGLLTGVLPFIVGAVWYSKLQDDFFRVLDLGAYLSLLFGAGLIVLASRRK